MSGTAWFTAKAKSHIQTILDRIIHWTNNIVLFAEDIREFTCKTSQYVQKFKVTDRKEYQPSVNCSPDSPNRGTHCPTK